MRLAAQLLVILSVFGAISIWISERGAGARDVELPQLLREESSDSVHAQGRPEISMNAAINRVNSEPKYMEGVVSRTLSWNSATVENELEALAQSIQSSNPEELKILESFGKGRSLTRAEEILRRLTFIHRHPGKIEGAERLEDLYLLELSTDPTSAVAAVARVLDQLPKSAYREEHVILWDLMNRVPEAHTRLQLLHPDEEFE